MFGPKENRSSNHYSSSSSSSSTSSNEPFTIDSGMSIAKVSLNVSDLNRSVDFYKSVLGFKTIGKVSSEKAVLGVNGQADSDFSHLVELLQAQGSQSANRTNKDFNPSQSNLVNRGKARTAGLYHFAVLLPERKFLADMLQNLNKNRDFVYFEGFADHLVSESIYIRDPDFIGIEIYRDRPKSQWSWRQDSDNINNNHHSQVEMATLPLNTRELLKEATTDGWKGMPLKTTIGHIHLHVSSTERARQFYQDSLGLELTARIPNALFFAANGYHHHVATNTWMGTDIAKAASETIGLNHFDIMLSNRQEFERLLDRAASRNIDLNKKTGISERSGIVAIHDPDDITIRLRCK